MKISVPMRLVRLYQSFFLPCALRKAVPARFGEALRAGIISDDTFPIFVTSSEVTRGRPTSDERSSEFIRGGDVTVYKVQAVPLSMTEITEFLYFLDGF